MKIAVTGASGMLGTALIYKFRDLYRVYATARSQGLIKKNVYWHCFDLTDLERLESWLLKTKPDVVIHCAAMVNVDECEIKEDLAYQLHVKTTEIIANFLNNHNGRLIYISTDSVFDGFTKKKYSEEKKRVKNIFVRDFCVTRYVYLVYKNNTYKSSSKLIGKYNLYNIMASVSACLLLGLDINKIIKSIS